jgi:drug/metabolite transporter (DMT)-like permease
MPKSSQSSDHPNVSLGYLFSGMSALFASVAIVTGKWTLQSISPLTLNALIFPIGAIILGLGMIPRKGWGRIFALNGTAWLWTLIFTVLAFVAIWTHWIGIKMMDPTLASFLNRSETLVTILLGVMILGERFTQGEGFGAILVLAGIVLMKFTLRMEYSTGFWVVLFSSVCFGTAEFIAKIAVRYVDPLTLSFVRNFISAVMFWIAVAFVGTPFAGVRSVFWGVIIIAFMGPILTRPIYLAALRHIEVSKVALINQSQPVFVAILALLALNQTPALREIIGGVFVIGGCLVIIISRKKIRPANAEKLPADRK